MKYNIWKSTLLVVLAILFILGGCSSQETGSSQQEEPAKENQGSGEPVKGGDLTVGMGADLTKLDLHTSTVLSDRIPLLHVQEMLVTIDDNMKIVPMLAKDWEMSEDKKKITFNLRNSVKFHNGKEMTSEDVKYSIERFMEVSPRKGEFSMVKSIEAPDKSTVVFNLKNPSGVFLASLANPFNPAVIVPKGLAEEQGGEITEPIGTGPFKFVSWDQGKDLVLARYDDYKSLEGDASGFSGKKEAYIDQVVFKPISEPSVRVTSLQTGEIDVALDVLPKDVNRLKSIENIVVDNKPSMNWGMLQFGMNKPPFDDPKMRKAVAYAISKEEIVNVATRQLGEVAHSPVFPETEWYNDQHKKDYEQNLEKAKELVEESGYNGEPIVISTSKAYDHHEKTAMVLKTQLEKIGLKVEVEALEWASFISDRWVTGDYHLLNGHITPRPDPNQIYYAYLQSSSSYNGYKSEKMDQLLEEGLMETDVNKRKEIYGEVQSLLREDLPFMSLYYYPIVEAHRDAVKGYESWSAGYPRFWNVWIEE
ncbi:ABC transporter substrate-binding protein [Bacillus tianshenii]|nr:ABC transporter substrate-binding protein [Bacillus tianshenii]